MPSWTSGLAVIADRWRMSPVTAAVQGMGAGGSSRGPRRWTGADRDRVAALPPPSCQISTSRALRAAVTELSAHLDRYRTYLPADESGRVALETSRLEAEAARPISLDRSITSAVRSPPPTMTMPPRCGPLAAVDRAGDGQGSRRSRRSGATWRWPHSARSAVRSSRHPIRSQPCTITSAMTAARWPTTMLAGTTHDVARSEDVRAVGLVLAAAAEAWTRVVDERVETPVFRTSTCPCAGWRCKRLPRRPDCRLSASPRSSSRPPGRRTDAHRGSSRTRPIAADSRARPRRVGVAPGGRAGRIAGRAGSGNGVGDAGGAGDGTGGAGRVRGHRGLPLPPRRPGQPAAA